jgi:hypothetical protein
VLAQNHHENHRQDDGEDDQQQSVRHGFGSRMMLAA